MKTNSLYCKSNHVHVDQLFYLNYRIRLPGCHWNTWWTTCRPRCTWTSRCCRTKARALQRHSRCTCSRALEPWSTYPATDREFRISCTLHPAGRRSSALCLLQRHRFLPGRANCGNDRKFWVKYKIDRVMHGLHRLTKVHRAPQRRF